MYKYKLRFLRHKFDLDLKKNLIYVKQIFYGWKYQNYSSEPHNKKLK